MWRRLLSLLLITALGGVELAAAERADAERAAAEPASYDLVIYGGNAAGVVAAVQGVQLGKSVVVIEPSRHLGGLTAGGLGATDIGNKAAIGGLAREFYRRVKRHYDQPAAWKFETRSQYREARQAPGEDTMWTFEPQVAETILRAWLAEAKVPVLLGQSLDRAARDHAGGVRKSGTRIEELTLVGGRRIRGKMFLDCTYEGDLLAAAGVSFTIGREANATYRETLNGVQTRLAIHHQLQSGVDPFVRRGDRASGLLPGIDATGPGEEGAADRRVQAYNLRLCVTDAPANRVPFPKPADYDERNYELLFRNFEAGERRVPWSPTLLPNRKTDTNNNWGFSTDFLGASYDWPAADAATREKIYRRHVAYTAGLMWTLANHSRVPEAIRTEVGRWGLTKDEFTATGGWSHQLYVREARRLVGPLVMTQHHCQGREIAAHPIGLAAYTMDSHHVQRYVDAAGHVRNEGDVQVGGFPPYPIGYAAITPPADQCTNLLVPVCLSASHIAYGSIRMEPVFMVLAQSAATAASLAIDEDRPVQQVPYDRLRSRLLEGKQVLDWTAKKLPPRR